MFIILFLVLVTMVAWIISLIRPELTDALIICVTIAYFVGMWVLIVREIGRCKNKKCRKLYAYEVVSRELYKTRNTKKPVTRRVYDDGHWKEIMMNEPATEYVYKVMEKCRFCGHEKPHYESEIH